MPFCDDPYPPFVQPGLSPNPHTSFHGPRSHCNHSSSDLSSLRCLTNASLLPVCSPILHHRAPLCFIFGTSVRTGAHGLSGAASPRSQATSACKTLEHSASPSNWNSATVRRHDMCQSSHSLSNMIAGRLVPSMWASPVQRGIVGESLSSPCSLDQALARFDGAYKRTLSRASRKKVNTQPKGRLQCCPSSRPADPPSQWGRRTSAYSSISLSLRLLCLPVFNKCAASVFSA